MTAYPHTVLTSTQQTKRSLTLSIQAVVSTTLERRHQQRLQGKRPTSFRALQLGKARLVQHLVPLHVLALKAGLHVCRGRAQHFWRPW